MVDELGEGDEEGRKVRLASLLPSLLPRPVPFSLEEDLKNIIVPKSWLKWFKDDKSRLSAWLILLGVGSKAPARDLAWHFVRAKEVLPEARRK